MFTADQTLNSPLPDLATLRAQISQQYAIDENQYVQELLTLMEDCPSSGQAVEQRAGQWIGALRKGDFPSPLMQQIMQQFGLNTSEGRALMSLAEALLRIPDTSTQNALICDKLSDSSWNRLLENDSTRLIKLMSSGLNLTSQILTEEEKGPVRQFSKKVSLPVIRKSVSLSMSLLSKQFVLAETIEKALKLSGGDQYKKYRFSFDMLGEAALCEDDAQRYYQSYQNAIEQAGRSNAQHNKQGIDRASISIKLSALHPRYEASQYDRVMTELYDRVLSLSVLARKTGVAITIDAEEADRLEISLDLFEKLYQSDELKGWGDLGLVVQAYNKQALTVLRWLACLARQEGTQIPLRLVKGAYWDTEMKLCQQGGFTGYPLFTRKENTDLHYLACARFLFSGESKGHIYPQFAGHNLQTISSLLSLATHDDYEFQRLYGMGEDVYACIFNSEPNINCRIYAPIGAYDALLPYLVRRLLENGANSSFINAVYNDSVDIDGISQTPLAKVSIHKKTDAQGQDQSDFTNPHLPLPRLIVSPRLNSHGTNLHVNKEQLPFMEAFDSWFDKSWSGHSLLADSSSDNYQPVYAPYHGKTQQAFDGSTATAIGQVAPATPQQVETALSTAASAWKNWNRTPVAKRAEALLELAELLEKHRPELIALCTREAGKTLQDGIDEVREAVDFCRYYAEQAELRMAQPTVMGAPCGETNELWLEGRGTFVCISPWNFPLAIFIGQIGAALVTGNTVVAKPAEQTPLIATRTIELAYEAGFPRDVLQLVLGGGSIGQQLVESESIEGVCFTGSTGTAQRINQTLANRQSGIIPLIAETGGLNAMISDSSALTEQLVKDVVHSAFQSAGQRCSALRVLLVQDDSYQHTIDMLTGAMQELRIGEPRYYATDVGPVIDQAAQQKLLNYIESQPEGRLLAQLELPEGCAHGFFVPPTVLRIDSLSEMKEEQFGPILHILRYQTEDLEQRVEEINQLGYGLTLGIHSRNERRIAKLSERLNIGNIYINRNQVGAVVGMQPFGGRGLSGTGPKAGGPHYLTRFITEKTISVNTAALGGNPELLSLED